DGHGEADVAAACGLCNSLEPKLRCKDCFRGLMFCMKCMIGLHACNTLHHLKVYKFYYQWLYTYSQHLTTQLLCACWYSATPIVPNTAATFNVLEHFHLLTFESKVSVFKFFHTLTHRTDNVYI
ncbi:hypothetical protein PILCRDRAFT_27155, partial [Piloderma croceum F 1598]